MAFKDLIGWSDPAVNKLENDAFTEIDILENAGLGDKSDAEQRQYLKGYYDAEGMRLDGMPERHIPAAYRR